MKKLQRKKTLSRSIFASLFFHVLALFFLQRHSLWFSSQNLDAQSHKKSWKSNMEVADKQKILKETFVLEGMKKEHVPQLLEEMITLSDPKERKVAPLTETAPRFSAKPMETPLLSLSPLPTFTLPEQSKLDLFEHLPKNLIIPKADAALPTVPVIPSQLATGTPPLVSSEPAAFGKELITTPLHTETLISDSWNLHPSLKKNASSIAVPRIPHLPTLAELDTLSYSDAFDADLVFLPKEDGTGYLFALTLIPRMDLKLPKFKQHYLFLIDRSNSIQSERLFATKNAVRRALDELGEGDVFNIIAFDNKIEKMTSSEVSLNAQTKAKAESFLEGLKLGSFFSSADLYNTLFLTVPSQVKPDEVYTVVLFTDGESLGKKQKTYEVLQNWTQYNNQKIALFPICVSSDPRLGVLDTAAMFNKGKIQIAPTHKGIKRKTLKTMKILQNPVAKNLRTSAVPLTPNAHVKLYPKAPFLPHLYLNDPYVILGTCETLDDFILFVQGRLHNRWMNIKKKISFLSAKKGTSSLKSEWALQCAYDHYESYLQDQDPAHIAEAKEILAPHNIQVAFE